MTETVDCVVVGAGVIGLAVARALALAGQEVLVLDQGPAVGRETSSRNSEVIHAGIHYAPGSFKARLCRAGRERLYTYCAARGIRHHRIGKVIVAASATEVHELEKYRAQALANGVDDLAWLSAGQLAGLEPEVRCAACLLSPSTGIISSHDYMLALQGELASDGGRVIFNTRVEVVDRRPGGFELQTAAGDRLGCSRLVNSAGLHAPALATRIEGVRAQAIPRAWYAKGHYFSLRGRSPFRRLVYPVAEKAGLGIHVTLDVTGAARFGPDVAWTDTIDYTFEEARISGFVAAIRRYYPALDASRLQPAYTGIRPRIYGPDEPAADFRIDGSSHHGVPGLVNLFGIESPGLTASLAIAEEVTALLT